MKRLSAQKRNFINYRIIKKYNFVYLDTHTHNNKKNNFCYFYTYFFLNIRCYVTTSIKYKIIMSHSNEILLDLTI